MLTKGEKTGLIGAGIAGLLGLGFYGLYQVTTASGTVTACKNTYNQISLLWYSTLEKYLEEDSANGISITPEQQANLNAIQAEASKQLQECSKLAKSSSAALDSVIGDVGYALLIFSSLVGVAEAIKILVKTGRMPKKPKNPPTPPEQFAYMLPITVQELLDEGKITPESATVFSGYLSNTLEPYLQEQNSAMYDFYVENSIIEEEELAALLAVSAAYISEVVDLSLIIIAA